MLGQAGFVGKGITFGIVGALMIVTGIDGRTGPPGLQTVFRLLNLSPAGGALLLLKALGLVLFGVYCFAWAGQPAAIAVVDDAAIIMACRGRHSDPVTGSHRQQQPNLPSKSGRHCTTCATDHGPVRCRQSIRTSLN